MRSHPWSTGGVTGRGVLDSVRDLDVLGFFVVVVVVVATGWTTCFRFLSAVTDGCLGVAAAIPPPPPRRRRMLLEVVVIVVDDTSGVVFRDAWFPFLDLALLRLEAVADNDGLGTTTEDVDELVFFVSVESGGERLILSSSLSSSSSALSDDGNVSAAAAFAADASGDA